MNDFAQSRFDSKAKHYQEMTYCKLHLLSKMHLSTSYVVPTKLSINANQAYPVFILTEVQALPLQ